MLFFGSRCERLCMIQFSLISLIPGLINHLQDCADPASDSYEQSVEKPTSLKTSDRSSCKRTRELECENFADWPSVGIHGASVADFRQGTQFSKLNCQIWCPNYSQGSMFGPYTPLQQLDLLADDGTKSYVVGSTNSLLLQQKDRYSDILINVSSTDCVANQGENLRLTN